MHMNYCIKLRGWRKDRTCSEQLLVHTAAQCASSAGRREQVAVLFGMAAAAVERLFLHCAKRWVPRTEAQGQFQIFTLCILALSPCRLYVFRLRSLTSTCISPPCTAQGDLRACWHQLCHHLSSLLLHRANPVHLNLYWSPLHLSTWHHPEDSDTLEQNRGSKGQGKNLLKIRGQQINIFKSIGEMCCCWSSLWSVYTTKYQSLLSGLSKHVEFPKMYDSFIILIHFNFV